MPFLENDANPELQEFALSAIIELLAIKEGDSIIIFNNRLLVPALIGLLLQPISPEIQSKLGKIFYHAITNRQHHEFFDYALLIKAIGNKFTDGVEPQMQLFYMQMLFEYVKVMPEHQKVILENEAMIAYLSSFLIDEDDVLLDAAAALLNHLLENNNDADIFSYLSSEELMFILCSHLVNYGSLINHIAKNIEFEADGKLESHLVNYGSLINHIAKNIEFEADGKLEEEFLLRMISWLSETEAVRL